MLKKAILVSLLISSSSLSAHSLTKADDSVNHATHKSENSTQATEFPFEFPDIDLVDHRNQIQKLNALFDKKNNVVFAFFFSHCVSVCTTVTLSLKSIQPKLPPDTLIAMISIDPDTDTPELLSSYAKQHLIDDPNWYLLTGESKQIVDLQKSFEAYRGNKMNHSTSLFVKKYGSEVITEIKNNFSVIPQILKNS